MSKLLQIPTLFLALSLSANFCSAASELTDVPYQFDQEKLAAAQNSFHFLRSYVDYYYLLMKENRPGLKSLANSWNFSGWCVGDAHPENFGVLLQKDGSSLFTMNDVDDSGPCPVALDLFRLMTASRLYNPDIKLSKIVDSYLQGLQDLKFQTPQAADDMLRKSQKKGTLPSAKKVNGNRLVRDSIMKEVSTIEQRDITELLKSTSLELSKKFRVLDMVSTAKVGGGSGGLLRYEILIDNDGALLHLEMKEEIKPSIYPVATADISQTAQRIQTAVQMTQGKKASPFYQAVTFNGKVMLIRPRFSGNVGVTLTDQSPSDNKDLIRFEAFQLGRIHARSVTDLKKWINAVSGISMDDFENDVLKMTRQFDKKFAELKK